jgi:hypothetical protein
VGEEYHPLKHDPLWLETNVQSNYSKQIKEKEERNRDRNARRKRPTKKEKPSEYLPHQTTLHHIPQAIRVDISSHKENPKHQR